MITPEVVGYARRSVLCWLATCDSRGFPNVTPKEVFAPFDDRHLVIANITSPGSARNIEANPAVCVSFIDVFVQKGFKLRGRARNVKNGSPDFPGWVAPLVAMTHGRFPIRSVFVVEVQEVEPIVAPSYRLFPGEVTEESQTAEGMRVYGVRPAGTLDDAVKVSSDDHER